MKPDGFHNNYTVDPPLKTRKKGCEGTITGPHDGEWAGIPPTGRRAEVPVAAIFEFDEDRLLCEKAYTDFAAVLTQIGVLPAIG
jgi:predicted ester cyclase